MAGPPADLRHPEPAFQQVELAADKRPDFRKPLAAIVAGEHDERIVAAGRLPHRVEHAADAGVEDLHHLAVDAGVAALGDLGAHRPRARRAAASTEGADHGQCGAV